MSEIKWTAKDGLREGVLGESRVVGDTLVVAKPEFLRLKLYGKCYIEQYWDSESLIQCKRCRKRNHSFIVVTDKCTLSECPDCKAIQTVDK